MSFVKKLALDGKKNRGIEEQRKGGKVNKRNSWIPLFFCSFVPLINYTVCMQNTSFASPHSVAISASTEAQVYSLFALAMGLTLLGIVAGIMFAPVLLNSGALIIMVIASLAIVFTSSFWMNRSPLNYLLFAAFPLISGITFTPYLLYILDAYVNGAGILLNAFAATVCMSFGAALFARTTKISLLGMQGTLLMGLIGLIVLGVLQLIFPGLRTGVTELLVSGFGVVLFAVFIAFDIQRITAMGRVGANPFLLALSLYLDVYNLFMYILRFMLAISGRRD